MKDSPLEPADQQLLDQAMHAWRENVPDDARMRRLESSLAPVLDAAPFAVWWRRPRVWMTAIVLAGTFGSVLHELRSTPSGASPSSHPSHVETQAASAIPIPEAQSPSMPTISVHSLAPVAVTATSAIEAKPAVARPAYAKPAAASSATVASTSAGHGRPEDATEASASSEAVADEVALLERARRALGADPALTLTLADEHVRRFTRPSFAQERERLAIDALVRLGRRAAAQQRARSFEAAFPNSPHLERVRALVLSPTAASSVERTP